MKDQRIAIGALLLLIAVAAGAFGAHGLRARLAPEALAQWHTAVEYQFYHGLGILLVAALSERLGPGSVRWASRLFLSGTLLFSGSIYLLSTSELTGFHGIGTVLGPITPVGGLLLMGGWATLLISAVRRPDVR